MPLKITAKLVDMTGKVMPRVIVQAYFLRSAGGAVAVGKGVTTSTGTLIISVAQAMPQYLPRLELRMSVGAAWRVLSNTPLKYTAMLASFGTLKVETSPVAKLGTNSLYALSANFSLTKPAPPTNSLALESTITTLNKQLSSLKVSNTNYVNKNKALTAEKVNITKQFNNLKLNNDTIVKENSALKANNAQLNNKLVLLQKDKDKEIQLKLGLAKQLQDDKEAFIAKEASYLKEQDRLTKDVSVLQKTNSSINNQISTLNADNKQLLLQQAELKSNLLNEQQALKVSKKQVTDLTSQLTLKEKQLIAAQEALKDKSPDETQVTDLFDSTAMHLESAQERLKQRSSGFSMSKVSLDIKVLPGQSGNTVLLPDKKQLSEIGADALSNIKVEFSDVSGYKGNTAGTQQIAVPDLMGYTQNLAHRKLQQDSLVAVIQEEYVGRGEVARERHGRVISQNPPAATMVMPNSAIYLVIGKATTELESQE